MGIVNSLKSRFRNLTNQNASANFADVNDAVKQYDSSNYQKMLSVYEITWPMGLLPVISAIAVNAGTAGTGTDCTAGTCKNCCPPQTPPHPSCGTSCNCGEAKSDKFCGKIDAIIVPTGVGTFTITLQDDILTSQFSVVQVGPASNPGDIITVQKVDNFTFNVSIYNVISGLYSSGTLDKVPLVIISDFVPA